MSHRGTFEERNQHTVESRAVPVDAVDARCAISVKGTGTMPDHLPIFPLNTVLFPGMPLPLRIFEERYLRMLDDQQHADPVFGVVLIRSGRESGSIPDIHAVGTAASLARGRHRLTQRTNVVVTGASRFHIVDVDWSRGYGMAAIDYFDEPAPEMEDVEALMRVTKGLLKRYVDGVTRLTGRRFDQVRLPIDPVVYSWELAARLPLHTWERQSLLEQTMTRDRILMLRYFLRRELALLHGAGAAGLALNHPGGSFTLN